MENTRVNYAELTSWPFGINIDGYREIYAREKASLLNYHEILERLSTFKTSDHVIVSTDAILATKREMKRSYRSYPRHLDDIATLVKLDNIVSEPKHPPLFSSEEVISLMEEARLAQWTLESSETLPSMVGTSMKFPLPVAYYQLLCLSKYTKLRDVLDIPRVVMCTAEQFITKDAPDVTFEEDHSLVPVTYFFGLFDSANKQESLYRHQPAAFMAQIVSVLDSHGHYLYDSAGWYTTESLQNISLSQAATIRYRVRFLVPDTSSANDIVQQFDSYHTDIVNVINTWYSRHGHEDITISITHHDPSQITIHQVLTPSAHPSDSVDIYNIEINTWSETWFQYPYHDVSHDVLSISKSLIIAGFVLMAAVDMVIMKDQFTVLERMRPQQWRESIRFAYEAVYAGVDWKLIPPTCGDVMLKRFMAVVSKRQSMDILHAKNKTVIKYQASAAASILAQNFATKQTFPVRSNHWDYIFVDPDEVVTLHANKRLSKVPIVKQPVEEDPEKTLDESDTESIEEEDDTDEPVNVELGEIIPQILDEGIAETASEYDVNSSELNQVISNNLHFYQGDMGIVLTTLRNRFMIPEQSLSVESMLAAHGIWDTDHTWFDIATVHHYPNWETARIESFNDTQALWRHTLFTLVTAFYFGITPSSSEWPSDILERVQQLFNPATCFQWLAPRFDVWYYFYSDMNCLKGEKSLTDTNTLLRQFLRHRDVLVEPHERTWTRITFPNGAVQLVKNILEIYNAPLIPLLLINPTHPQSTFALPTIRDVDDLSSFLFAMYWTCITARTDALRLYGPLALTVLVCGRWKMSNPNADNRIPEQLYNLFRDDCSLHWDTRLMYLRVPKDEGVEDVTILTQYYYEYFTLAGYPLLHKVEEKVHNYDYIKKGVQNSLGAFQSFLNNGSRGLDAPRFIRHIYEFGTL